MLNHVTLMGRFTADPELKTTPNGTSVVSIRLAVERNYLQEDKTRATDFIPLVFWRHTAEFVARNFRKGQMVAVVGELQTHQYTDKDLNKRTSIEVVCQEAHFASDKPKGSTASPEANGEPTPDFQAMAPIGAEDVATPF